MKSSPDSRPLLGGANDVQIQLNAGVVGLSAQCAKRVLL